MKGIDTNVLVRYLTQDDPEQSRRAVRYIEGATCFISCIVLCELVWVLESAYDYPRLAVAQVLEKILMTGEFQVEDHDLAWNALGDYRHTKADFADCLIGRRNRAVGCDETGSFDKNTKDLTGYRLL